MPTRTTLSIAALALSVLLAGSALTAGVALGSQAVTDDDPTTQETSYLRISHAAPDAPAVDVYLDNESVFTNVTFGTASDYSALTAGTHNVTITAAGEPDSVVFEETIRLDARSVTTLAVGAGAQANATVSPIVLDDNAFTPADDESAISVVHLSPAAPAVDVVVPGTGNETNATTVLADNVSYGGASDYQTISPGEYRAEIRVATPTDDGTVLKTVTLTVAGGSAYSALAVGFDGTANETDAGGVVLTRDGTLSLALPAGSAAPENGTDAVEPGAPNETAAPGEETATEIPTEAE